MSDITNSQVKDAIRKFLYDRSEQKVGRELTALEKLDVVADAQKIAEIKMGIAKLREKHELDNWMMGAASSMASQLRSATHISKGIHPKSEGDSLNFRPATGLPEGWVGSQSVPDHADYAVRDAKALPLAAFFEICIDDATGIKLRQLITEEHSALEGVFSSDPELSKEYAKRFKTALDNVADNPSTDELNKQLLWPLNSAVATDAYVVLVPLHPSVLVRQFYQVINNARFSEENKQARENRRKVGAEQKAYLSIPDIGVIKLGGTKPQNVSQLTSKQGGRNYLLSSLPPILGAKQDYRLNKSQKTLFDSRLVQCCSYGLAQLYEVITAPKNTVDVRDSRKEALDLIIAGIIKLAEQIQQNYAPGWSKDYQLPMQEKYWLDPNRADLEGENEFDQHRKANNWQADIVDHFALWLNERLQSRFSNLATHFGDEEFSEWQREIEDAIKASLRMGREVFA